MGPAFAAFVVGVLVIVGGLIYFLCSFPADWRIHRGMTGGG
jgi:hypothetical protein